MATKLVWEWHIFFSIIVLKKGRLISEIIFRWFFLKQTREEPSNPKSYAMASNAPSFPAFFWLKCHGGQSDLKEKEPLTCNILGG